MGLGLLGIDAFADEAFRGNPAVVCLVDRERAASGLDEEWMQALAAEMNLSETAFVTPRRDGFGLRWFTPTTEVQLCGHATLASAHALWETGRLAPDATARFDTRWKGELTAVRTPDGIALDFPAARSIALAEPPPGLEDALGVHAETVAINDLHHLVEVADASTVRSLSPDFALLLAVDVESVAVTARSDDDRYDFVSRYFAPRYGIDEDPVTGSAHTTLGPWWSERLGRETVTGYQASARGGVVRVRVAGERVTLTGRAVTVWRGELEI